MTDTIVDCKPGSFGLARIGGLTGKLIAAGQAFSGDGSRFTHAFIVLDDGNVIEAEPGGARITPLQHYLDMKEVVFCDTPVQMWLHELDFQDEELLFELEEALREEIVDEARRLEGTPYGYLQYVALGLVALGFKPQWLTRFIADRGRLICSQLCDEVYRRVGIQLFDDGRLPQQVTPGDLAIRFGIG